MKKIYFIIFAFTSILSGFEIPEGTYHIGQLKQAAKKAAQKNQALTFLITDKRLTPT